MIAMLTWVLVGFVLGIIFSAFALASTLEGLTQWHRYRKTKEARRGVNDALRNLNKVISARNGAL